MMWIATLAAMQVILVGQLSETVVYSEPIREMPVELQELTQ